MKIKTLIIDHYDSFTYNIKSWLEKGNFEVKVVYFDDFELINIINSFDLILFSPGPGNPNDYPKSLELIEKYKKTKTIFGICLGLQMMLTNDNIKISPFYPPVHGKQSIITTNNKSIFENIPQMKVARYHSLGSFVCGENYEITAKIDNGLIMGIEHKMYKIAGVQFHPESFLTEKSDVLLNNLEKWVKERINS